MKKELEEKMKTTQKLHNNYWDIEV